MTPITETLLKDKVGLTATAAAVSVALCVMALWASAIGVRLRTAVVLEAASKIRDLTKNLRGRGLQAMAKRPLLIEVVAPINDARHDG